MTDRPELQVGQTLWYVPAFSRRDPYEVTITKIGRKWATVDNGNRVDRETLVMDGGQYSSPGRCYLSRAAYEEMRAANLAWEKLSRRLARRRSANASIATIRAAAALLGIDLESPE